MVSKFNHQLFCTSPLQTAGGWVSCKRCYRVYGSAYTISMPAMLFEFPGSCPIQRITPYHGDSFCSTFTTSPTSKALGSPVVWGGPPSFGCSWRHSCSPEAAESVDATLKVLFGLPVESDLSDDEKYWRWLRYWRWLSVWENVLSSLNSVRFTCCQVIIAEGRNGLGLINISTKFRLVDSTWIDIGPEPYIPKYAWIATPTMLHIHALKV